MEQNVQEESSKVCFPINCDKLAALGMVLKEGKGAQFHMGPMVVVRLGSWPVKGGHKGE